MSKLLTINQISEAAKTAAAEYPILRIDLFGSYADGTNTENSDVDLLVEFDKSQIITLITISGLKIRLEELLNTPVDVVSLPIPKDSILEIEKVVPLYAA